MPLPDAPLCGAIDDRTSGLGVADDALERLRALDDTRRRLSSDEAPGRRLATARAVGGRALSARALRARARGRRPRGTAPITTTRSATGSSRSAPFEPERLRAALVDRDDRRAGGRAARRDRVFWRSRFKYGLRGYRFALLEAGHAARTRCSRRPRWGWRRFRSGLLRPAARRARRRRRPRRGDRLRARAGRQAVSVRAFWLRVRRRHRGCVRVARRVRSRRIRRFTSTRRRPPCSAWAPARRWPSSSCARRPRRAPSGIGRASGSPRARLHRALGSERGARLAPGRARRAASRAGRSRGARRQHARVRARPPSAAGLHLGDRSRCSAASTSRTGALAASIAAPLVYNAAPRRAPGLGSSRRRRSVRAVSVAELDDVTKRFGAAVALDERLVRDRGRRVVAVLGPNGAGKSTALAVLLGLRRPDAAVRGSSASTHAGRRSRRHVGVTPQETAFPATLRVRRADRADRPHYEYPLRPEVVVRCFGLANLERRQLGGLSAGQRRRVGVALAFCGAPRLIVLDEPTAALDGDARRAVWDAIRAHVRRGGTVLLTTHHLDEAEALADRVVLLERGAVVADGSIAQIKAAAGATRVSFRAPPGTEIEGAVREGDAADAPHPGRRGDGDGARPGRRAARGARGAAADARGGAGRQRRGPVSHPMCRIGRSQIVRPGAPRAHETGRGEAMRSPR